MYNECRYLLIIEGRAEEIERFDKQGRVFAEENDDKECGGNLLLSKLILDLETVKLGIWGDWSMEKYGVDIAIPVIYDKGANSYTFIVDPALGVDIFIKISEQFREVKFTYEYKDFKYEEEEIADYGKFICQNGNIEYIDHCKIRCSFCPDCGSVKSFEQI